MQIEDWRHRFPQNDFKEAVAYLNSLDWNISINHSQKTDEWLLIAGDKLIASFDTNEELKAFVFGMAFGFAVLPDEVIDHILKIIRD